MKLREIATARSGDKGSIVNVALMANDERHFDFIEKHVTESVLLKYFHPLGVTEVKCYKVPQLATLNFVLYNALEKGGSLLLRSDSQGKAVGEMLLEMEVEGDD